MNTSPSRVSPRTLDIVAGVSLLVALVLLVWPTRAVVQPIAPIVAATKVTASVGADISAAQLGAQIVDGNVFSATRRAPTVRFVPPGTEPAGTAPAASVMLDGRSDDGNIATVADRPRLFGIVAQDGRRRALLQLPGADSVPRLLDVGDRRGGYRVVSISDDRVVLASSTGSRTLRLVSRTSPDSLENLP